MDLPNNYQIIQKNVKHARIRVSNDGSVRITIPHHFLQQDLEILLHKKQSWIEKHQAFFRNQTKINLQRNQLLLYGDRYHYFYESSSSQVVINYPHKTLQSNLNLLDKTTQETWYKSIAKEYL
ncbi:MAG: YgjP-like metallopeptidase domain-containing protein, partial [Microcystaceae cyanobacterium]